MLCKIPLLDSFGYPVIHSLHAVHILHIVHLFKLRSLKRGNHQLGDLINTMPIDR